MYRLRFEEADILESTGNAQLGDFIRGGRDHLIAESMGVKQQSLLFALLCGNIPNEPKLFTKCQNYADTIESERGDYIGNQ